MLEGLCDEHGPGGGQAAKTAREAVEAMPGLPADPTAGAAFETLAAADTRIMALTNGSASVAKRLLSEARLDRFVGHVVSIEEVRLWKPRREVYLRAAEVAGVFPPALGLVAAHGWDVHGARQAGLPAAFVARGRAFPPHMDAPSATGETLEAAARALLRAPRRRLSDRPNNVAARRRRGRFRPGLTPLPGRGFAPNTT